MQLDSWHCFVSQMMICQISSYYSSIPSYSAECWAFINHAEVQQLFLKCLLCSKIVFYSILLYFFCLMLKQFSIFTLGAFAFLFTAFASLCSQWQSSVIISPLTALTQSHQSCQSMNVYLHLHSTSLFTHNCTASRFPLSHNSDPNTSCS